ncbi:MAG: sensor histidine kinase [Tepidisphaerales bacterium]
MDGPGDEVAVVTADRETGGGSVPAERIEELGRIILAYSEVTERLERSHEQLTREVQRLQAELGEKNRQLERRNRLAALGEMAAGLAHEIRNPLGAMQLYLSALAADFAEGSAGARTVEKMRLAVRRLEGIVSQVLQFARELRVQPGEASLSAVVAECVDMVAGKAACGRVVVRVSGAAGGGDGTACTAWFDRLLMSQAVLNVLQNAVEASPAGGWVEVVYGVEGGEAFVRVADSGPGVPPEVMDRIFNPFFTTKDEGTGLGLSIVHRIAEAHDGTVTVRNGDGGGAVFELRWPSRRPAGRRREAA